MYRRRAYMDVELTSKYAIQLQQGFITLGGLIPWLQSTTARAIKMFDMKLHCIDWRQS